MSAEPEAVVAALAARSERVETPCGDGTMVWRVWGRGAALVLLHGGHGSWTHWVRNVEALSEHHRILVADMPGYGESASPPDPYTAESLAEIVAGGVVEILGEAERFDIAGFSFGSVVGGHVARLRGNQVRRFVLVGGGGLALPRAPLEPLRPWRHLESEEERAAAHRFNLTVLMLHDPARVDPLAVHVQAENARRTRINSVAIANTDTLRRCLPKVAASLAGIWGEHDVTAAPYIDQRRDLLRTIDPDCPFTIIAGAGHWVQYEAPDAFHPVLLRLTRP